MPAAGVACAACGFELPPTAKFCLECGAPIAAPEKSAEYKQVTVLFADVVHRWTSQRPLGRSGYGKS